MNIIKLEALDEDLLVDINKAIEISEVIQSRISTVVISNIKLIKLRITFHLVHSDFPISTDYTFDKKR